MTTVRLGKSELIVPKNGFGALPIQRITLAETVHLLHKALDNGMYYFDTARFYTDSEEKLGAAFADRRDKVIISTKTGATRVEDFWSQLETSLLLLRTDYIDLYLIHWPKLNPQDLQWRQKIRDTWRAMEELYKEGKCRAIGVCNFLPHHLQVILDDCEIVPMVDQLELHVGYLQQYTLDFCRAHNILPQAWSPLGRMYFSEEPCLQKMAKQYGRPVSQLLLRFLNQSGIQIIPKSTHEDRMKDNMDIFGFTINEEDMHFLSVLPQIFFSKEFPDWAERG